MTKRNKIQRLPDNVINQIAAGEVVERPASIVKELIENSIDAKADHIIVKIENAGSTLIQIIDNGIGMNAEELKLAFKEHTTSKIRNITDLNTLKTLGFRGEALASIASVAKIEAESNDGRNANKLIINNNTYKITKTAINKGTSIKIKDIFYNIPVRKKFLRSPQTEFKHIQDIFIKHAIINPQIHFELFSNSKQIFNLPKTNKLETRINDIWPKKFKNKLIKINYTANLNINGLLGHPDIAGKNVKQWQFIYINNRPIKSDLISKAIKDAYLSSIYKDFYPIFFINIALNPHDIDINIHPRKNEVKFMNTGKIYSIVKQASQVTLENFLQNSVKHTFSSNINNVNNFPPSGIKKATPNRSYSQANFLSNPTKLNETKKGYHKKSEIEQSLNFSKNLLNPILENKQDTQQTELLNKKEVFNGDETSQQFFKTYILLERDDKLLFIDQHAAHERINYEKIMTKFENGENIQAQDLLVPKTLELAPAEFQIIINLKKDLMKIGIYIEKFGVNTISLKAMPTIFKNFNFENFVNELLQTKIQKININRIMHKIVATMACHGSIRAGQKLQKEQIRDIVINLFKCKKPYTCPHGRPIVWEITKYEIEKKFKRTGFC